MTIRIPFTEVTRSAVLEYTDVDNVISVLSSSRVQFSAVPAMLKSK